MRNLKKILALVLALVMSLSVMTIANAKFNDVDENSDYSEAIEVMNAIGVLNGKGGNNFDPQGTLTRAEAAKIVTYMLLGDMAETLRNEATPFSDVPSGHWASGYIAYCYANGILDGIGGGKFNPNGILTGHEFGKMILTALKIDGKYTGTSWAINVASALSQNELLDNLSGLVLSASLPREQAAQMAFNGLLYAPAGTSSQYVVYVEDAKAGYDGTEQVLYRGTDALTALVLKQSSASYGLTLAENREGALSTEVFGLTSGTTIDAFGRSSRSWKVNNKDVVVLGRNPAKTYTTGVSINTLGRDLGYASVEQTFSLTVIKNGASLGTQTVNRGATADGQTWEALGGRGTLTEIYRTGTHAYTAYVIDTYVKQLDDPDIIKAVAATDKTDAQPRAIILEGTKENPTLVYETDDFKKGDVILYTKTTTRNGEVAVTAVLAPAFSGSVSGVGAGYFRVGETQYVASANAPKAGQTGAMPTAPSNDTYTFYTDSYNNPIYAVKGQSAAATYGWKPVYLIATALQVDTSSTPGSNLFEDNTSTSNVIAQAQIIDVTTGDIKVVNEAVAKNTDGDWFYAGPNGAANSDRPITKETEPRTNVGNLMYYVQLENGAYVFATPEFENVTLAARNTNVAEGLFANAATKVTKLELTKNARGAIVSAKVITSTGYASFPSYKGNAIVEAERNGLVSSILYFADYVAPKTVTYGVYAGAGETVLGSDGQPITLHAFYVNGELVNYGVKGELALEKNHIYTIEVSGTTVTAAEDITNDMNEGTVTYADETFMVLRGSNATYDFSSTCVVLNADLEVVTDITAIVGQTISYYETEAGVDLVIIG